jgi:peptidoglycan/xylan/chitin deacetylase (PgdA/CDA1 family)
VINVEPWEWPEDYWRREVQRVRAGQRLQSQWPDRARVAVAISFDPDHETIPLRDGQRHPGKLSQGEYGARVAVPRILALLERYSCPATFFMPAVAALLHPHEPRLYVENGHEVGVHGWIHEKNTDLPADVERSLIERSRSVLEQLTGVLPVGIRTPSWDFSPSTLDIVADCGFEYDSSLMADDECYLLRSNGIDTGVVEVPVEWIRDDAAYFLMDRYTALRPYIRPRDVLEIWRDEFDAAYREGGLFQLTLHPHVIGHRSRLLILDELLRHIASHDGVWYATHADVARAQVKTSASPASEEATLQELA